MAIVRVMPSKTAAIVEARIYLASLGLLGGTDPVEKQRVESLVLPEGKIVCAQAARHRPLLHISNRALARRRRDAARVLTELKRLLRVPQFRQLNPETRWQNALRRVLPCHAMAYDPKIRAVGKSTKDRNLLHGGSGMRISRFFRRCADRVRSLRRSGFAMHGQQMPCHPQFGSAIQLKPITGRFEAGLETQVNNLCISSEGWSPDSDNGPTFASGISFQPRRTPSAEIDAFLEDMEGPSGSTARLRRIGSRLRDSGLHRQR